MSLNRRILRLKFKKIIEKRIFKQKKTYVIALIVLVLLIKTPWGMIWDRTLGAISYLITIGNPVQIEDPKETFKTTDDPEFSLSIPGKTDKGIGKEAENRWQEGDEIVSAQAIHKGTNRTIPVTIKKNAQGKFEISVQKRNNHFIPGEYTLKVSSRESFIYTRNLDQNFSWGVLSINVNKSIYAPREEAKLSMGVIDETGHTICDAKLKLEIRNPKEETVTLSSQNGLIRQSGMCQGDSFVMVADYQALYTTSVQGTYQMTLTAQTKNGNRTISDTFEVRDSVPFDIERTEFPSRIYPKEIYPVILTVKANEDFKGSVVETVPSGFETKCQQGIFGEKGMEFKEGKEIPQCEIEYAQGVKGLVWQVDLKKNQTITLYYTIKFPDVSPEYYLIGPLKLFTEQNALTAINNKTLVINPSIDDHQINNTQDSPLFEEIRQWQIASDATTAIEQQINILNQTYSTTSNSSAGMPNDNSLGLICYKRSANTTDCTNGASASSGDYTGAAVYFEADLKNSTGATTYAALYDSNGNLVSNSKISTDSLTYTRVRSDPITSNLVSGTNYTARIYTSDATSTGSIIAARLIILQSTTGTFTDTQTIVEVGSNTTTASTTMVTLANPKYFQYDNSKYNGTKTAYLEATIKTTAGTASVELYNRTDAAVVGASTITTTSTSWTLVRSDALTTNWDTSSADEYEIRWSTSSGTASIANAKIIIAQTEAGGITNLQTFHNYINSAQIQNAASFGTFSTTNQGQILRILNSHSSIAQTVNGSSYVYTIGGTTGTVQSTIYKATINPVTANLGTFATTSQSQLLLALNENSSTNTIVGSSTYVYVLGGTTGAVRSTVYKSTLNDLTGNAGAFATTSQVQLLLVRNAQTNFVQTFGSSTYIYALGGCNAACGASPTTVSTVYRSTLNLSTGNTGTFATTSQNQFLLSLRDHNSLVAAIGSSTYVYLIGGNNNNTVVSTVYQASFNTSTGIINAFATTSQAQLPALRNGQSAISQTVGPSTYLYVLGGSTGSVISTVYKSTLNSSNGSVGAFSTTNQAQLPAILNQVSSVSIPTGGTNYLYVIGGTTGTVISTVYKSQLSNDFDSFGFFNLYDPNNWQGGVFTYNHEATLQPFTNATTGTARLTPGSQGQVSTAGTYTQLGDTGTFATTNQSQLLRTSYRHSSVNKTVGSSTYLYVLGGDTGSTAFSTVYKTTFNSTTGDMGAFATTSQAQLIRNTDDFTSELATIGSSTYIYAIGGCTSTACTTGYSSVYKSTLNSTSGDAGTFATTSQAQFTLVMSRDATIMSSTGSSTYLYVMGGWNATINYTTVYKSTLNATTGEVGAFATTSQSQLVLDLRESSAVTSTVGSSSYIYVIAGRPQAGVHSAVYKTTIDSATGNLSAFATTSQAQFPSRNQNHYSLLTAVGSSTYVYVFGGCDPSCAANSSVVYKSTLNASNGNLGTFATSSQAQIPQLAAWHTATNLTIGNSSYLYVVGGSTGGTTLSTNYKSTLTATINFERLRSGAINLETLQGANQQFATTSQGQLPSRESGLSSVTGRAGGVNYLYVVGGGASTIYRSAIDASSNAGTFDTTNQAQFPQLTTEQSANAYLNGADFMFVLGGYTGTTIYSTVYRSQLNYSNGTVGSFATTNQGQLLQGLRSHTSATVNKPADYLYVVGGCNTTDCSTAASTVSTVYKSTIQVPADVGAFATTSQSQLLAITRLENTVVLPFGSSTYAYVLGGVSGGAAFSTVYKTTLDSSTGNMRAFATTSQSQLLLVSGQQHSVTSVIGSSTYVYVIGGITGATAYSTAYKATFNTTTGNVGAFATTSQSQLIKVLSQFGQQSPTSSTIGPSTYIYVLGGTDAADQSSTVYKVTLDSSTGNLGAFATTSQPQLPAIRRFISTVTSTVGPSTYLYTIGGEASSTHFSTVYKVTLDSSTGNLGAFATTSQPQLPQQIGQGTAVLSSVGASTYVYVVGGCSAAACSGRLSTVYKSTINSNSGDLETFSTTNQGQLPQAIRFTNTVAANIGPSAYLYVLAGDNAANISTVYKSTLDTSATLSSFATTSQAQVPQPLMNHQTVSANVATTSYLYTLGGFKVTGVTVTGPAVYNTGTFATTNQGQMIRPNYQSSYATTTVGSSTYIYAILGRDTGSGVFSTVYKSTIDSTTGDTGAFATTSQTQMINSLRELKSLAVDIGPSSYLYVLGGRGSGAVAPISTVYKSIIDSSSGNTLAFATASQGQLLNLNRLPGVTSAAIGSSTYLYVIGGCNASTCGNVSTVYKSNVNTSNGNAATFATASQIQLSTGISGHTLNKATIGPSTYLYLIGGVNSAGATISTVYKSPLNDTTGNVGTFSTVNQGQLLSILATHHTVTATIGSSTYLYVIGGNTGAGASTIYKSTLDGTTGDAGTLATTNQILLPDNVDQHFAMSGTFSGSSYIYVLGGNWDLIGVSSTVYKSTLSGAPFTVDVATLSTVYKSSVDSSANANTFDTTSQAQLPKVLQQHAAVNARVGETNYVYVIGGCSDTSSTCAFTDKGNTGTFATTNQGQLINRNNQLSATSATIGSSTYIYVIGGADSAAYSTVFKSNVNSTTGDAGTFSTASQAQLLVGTRELKSIAVTVGASTYVYVLGGRPIGATAPRSTVYKSVINTSGDAVAFATVSQGQLLSITRIPTTVSATIGSSTYLYVLGGCNASTCGHLSSVYRATLNTDSGNVGTFATVSQAQLLTGLGQHTANIVNIGSVNYIYIVGGQNTAGATVSTIYKSSIDNATGNIGAFATTNQGQIPSVLAQHDSVSATIGSSSYLYIMGGNNGNGESSVYKATISAANGNLSPISTTNQIQLPDNIDQLSTLSNAFGSSTYIYVIGGNADIVGGPHSTVFKSTLLSEGNLGNSVYRSQIDSSANAGSFTAVNVGQFPISIASHTISTAKIGPSTYLYVIGGCNNGGCTDLSTVYKANILNSEYDEELQNSTVSSGWLVITFSPTPTANTIQVLIKGGTVIKGGTRLGI